MVAGGQRAELAAFLRSRRTQLDRSALGLPGGTRRSTPGLRREEVAALSGISVTWYTWLEQARDVNPSRQVLDSLAAALRLTPAEHTQLSTSALDLIGSSTTERVDGVVGLPMTGGSDAAE